MLKALLVSSPAALEIERSALLRLKRGKQTVKEGLWNRLRVRRKQALAVSHRAHHSAARRRQAVTRRAAAEKHAEIICRTGRDNQHQAAQATALPPGTAPQRPTTKNNTGPRTALETTRCPR